MTMQTVYLNGEFMPITEARIPVLDRGFLFGDGIYEYVPVYNRRPFRLHEHFARLERSLAAVRMTNPFTEADFAAVTQQLIDAQAFDNQGVYVQITRGVAPREHAFPRKLAPTVFMMSNPLTMPTEAQITRGVSVVVREDFRWLRNDIKAISLLGHCMLRTEASDEGCAEVVLVREGYLTEASSSNVLIVKDGKVLSPPKTQLILAGVTYDVILELLDAHAMPHEVRAVTEAELRSADEVWLTSSSKEVLPVTELDFKPVGYGPAAGKPGPVFRRMLALYQDFKARHTASASAATSTGGTAHA
jgi:D-alanine transaminase